MATSKATAPADQRGVTGDRGAALGDRAEVKGGPRKAGPSSAYERECETGGSGSGTKLGPASAYSGIAHTGGSGTGEHKGYAGIPSEYKTRPAQPKKTAGPDDQDL